MTQTTEERKARDKARSQTPKRKAWRKKNDVKNREKIRARDKARSQTPKRKAWAKKNAAKNREKINADMRKWRSIPENREKHRAWTRDWANRTRLERKQKVFSHYTNGSLKCACCGVKGLEFLTLDHIISRKAMESDLQLMSMGYSAKLHGKDLYYWLEKNNFPSGFQILCWNCNFAKGSLGKCPHKK